ncbi:MAG TPA: flavin reductase family protein [Trebonia sp.]|nr:flavin reductase family protein [Trebonia sp.]
MTTPDRFRHVLGHFCTGVTVITAADSAGPAGFTCQSFTALSLDPPLVLFCPGKSSSTWRRIEGAGRFCANVLADGQQEIARQFASRAVDKFDGVAWSPLPSRPDSAFAPSSPDSPSSPRASLPPGPPLLDGALAWVDAEVETVHDGGDHWVVIGRVLDLGSSTALGQQPLLFYRGRFTITEPESGTPELIDTLLAWPRHADWI